MEVSVKRQALKGPRPTSLEIDRSSKLKSFLPKQNRSPVIIHLRSPKIIHVSPTKFRELVQQLTGKKISDESSSSLSKLSGALDMESNDDGNDVRVNHGDPNLTSSLPNQYHGLCEDIYARTWHKF